MAQRKSVTKQMFEMVMKKKSYWLIPIIAVFMSLIILTLLASFGGGAATPFIYTLF